MNKYIGTKIQSFRNEKKFTQDELSKKLNLTRTSITNIESGIQPISIIDLYRLALVFEKEITDFLPSMEEIKIKSKSPEEKIKEDESLTEAQKKALASVAKKLIKE